MSRVGLAERTMRALAIRARAYQAIYAVSADDVRTRVEAEAIVADFGEGRELGIELSQHPASRGGVMLSTGIPFPVFAPARRRRGPTEFAIVAVYPNSGCGMEVSLENYSPKPGRRPPRARSAEASQPLRLSLVAANGTRTPVDAPMVVLDLGRRKTLRFEPTQWPDGRAMLRVWAGAEPTNAEFGLFKKGGRIMVSLLEIRFGGANVVHVLVKRRLSIPGGARR